MKIDYGKNWSELSQACKRRDNYICQVCGKDCSKDKLSLHAHHIIPLSKGGRNTLSNLISLCETCHSRYHHKTIKVPKRTFRPF